MTKNSSWTSAKSWLSPVDATLSMRKSDWTCVCDSCQQERFISYSQAFNILKGKTRRQCVGCSDKNGEMNRNLSGLKLGHVASQGIKRKSNKSAKLTKALNLRNVLNNPSKTDEVKVKMRIAKLGKTGELASRWEGGKTEERRLLTSRDEYKILRKSVLIRDDFTCQMCQTRGGKLEVDHLKEWCNYPSLRFEPTNLRTLCEACHKMTPNYGSKAKKLGEKNGLSVE